MNITYKGVTKNLKYYKGLSWNKPLTEEMELYKRETGKNAIRGGKITGTFEYWLYWNNKRKPLPEIRQDIHTEKETNINKNTWKNIKNAAKYHGKSEQKINNIKISDDIILKDVSKLYYKEDAYFYKYTMYYKNKNYGQDVIWAFNIEDLINKLYSERNRKFPFLKKKKSPDNTTDKIRLRILELLYYNLFYDTKMLAGELNISTTEAYKHAKWLEDHDLIYGQASDGSGVSTPRGTARIHSILWEANWSDEHGDNWTMVKKEYFKKKQPKIKKKKSKQTKTISKKYIPKDINIEKNRLNIEKLIKNNRNKIKKYNETFDKIEKLKKDGYGKNYKEIRELRIQLDKINIQIIKNNQKIFKFAQEAKIKTKYKKEPKSKKMLYYIDKIEPV